MPGLHLYRSNRVEELARGLGDLLETPLRDPLQPELVVVQSLGMRRWLSFQIAARLGIAMNCEFPFFADFAQRVFAAALPEESVSTRAFSREALLWRILAAFPSLLPLDAFAELRRYIGSDEASELKRFQLARQVATVFDQYMAYLPERLLGWQSERGGDWQPQLWRDLAGAPPRLHPPALLLRLQARAPDPLPGFPERLSVFGIASLPPFYLQLLAQACRVAEVHLFLFEPTDQYWADLRSRTEQARFLQRHGKPGQTAAEHHLESGNELLVSLGRAGRAFSSTVQDLEPEHFHEAFRLPESGTRLGRLQADIFALQEAGEQPAAEEDRSIQIHCCHGPMREVEVLHDQLLALFEQYPGLTPKDVLVTMPDVETHAPFIDAVFGSPEKDALRIPYTIADRSARAESGVVRAFSLLLDLHGSRFAAGAVLELLETRAVRERFEIDEGDLETIRIWIERTKVRWGIDGAHRAEFDLPPFEQNSWRLGLDRLLLGYAWAGDGESLFEGLLPEGDIEGGLAALLGRFAEFADRLFELVPRLSSPRSPRAWSEYLARLLTTFFSERGEDAPEVLRLGRMLSALAEWEEFHPEPVSFPVLRAYLASVVSEAAGAGGFLAGHVTFCSLKPMRSIPFRVICMLGMNDGAFPRRDSPIAFDLLAAEGTAAGRSRRDEDRQLFLESLLSAREVFYLSYTGLSAKDNRESPPSVVVSELLDYLAAGLPASPDETDPRRRLITFHRLQPFSPAYFGGDARLFSYSEENSRAFAKREVSAGPFAGDPLPEAALDWEALPLRALIDFLCHPARSFLEVRLGARLPWREEGLADSEPMALDALDRWRLSHRLVEGAMAGKTMDEMAQAARAAGLLPHGHFGTAQIGELHASAQVLGEEIANADLGAKLPPQPLTARGAGWALHGTLEDLHERGQQFFTAWEMKPRDRLRAWVSHLLLNAAGDAALPKTTVLFAIDETMRLEPCPGAAALLADLIELLREGMRRPLPFFPKSSFALAQRVVRPTGREKVTPEEAGRRVFEEEEKTRDPAIEFCFRHLASPCEEEWRNLSLRVWRPMLEP